MNAYVFLKKVIQCGVRLVWSEEKVNVRQTVMKIEQS